MNKSHLTAIVRKRLPAPTRYLMKHRLIEGDVLDYGCGKCFEIHHKHIESYDGYDPFYRPGGITKSRYDTILCFYVLNVIEDPKERNRVLSHIDQLLKPNGTAYIAVRRDITKDYYSKRGTWQGVIYLDELDMVIQTTDYAIYRLNKGTYAPENRRALLKAAH
jgi:SAM-dependent methyltransferase